MSCAEQQSYNTISFQRIKSTINSKNNQRTKHASLSRQDLTKLSIQDKCIENKFHPQNNIYKLPKITQISQKRFTSYQKSQKQRVSLSKQECEKTQINKRKRNIIKFQSNPQQLIEIYNQITASQRQQDKNKIFLNQQLIQKKQKQIVSSEVDNKKFFSLKSIKSVQNLLVQSPESSNKILMDKDQLKYQGVSAKQLLSKKNILKLKKTIRDSQLKNKQNKKEIAQNEKFMKENSFDNNNTSIVAENTDRANKENIQNKLQTNKQNIQKQVKQKQAIQKTIQKPQILNKIARTALQQQIQYQTGKRATNMSQQSWRTTTIDFYQQRLQNLMLKSRQNSKSRLNLIKIKTYQLIQANTINS